MSQQWIIIYPKGNKTKLDMALAFFWEFGDWSRASRQVFECENREEAKEYGRQLAKEHGLEAVGELYDKEDDFLD